MFVYKSFFSVHFLFIFFSVVAMFFVIVSSGTYTFQYQTSFAELNSGNSIGFGGNNPNEKIDTNSNHSIPNVGEINNFNSTSKGLKIFVTFQNISNLLNLDKNISNNLFLKVEDHGSLFNESDYLTYKFSKSDFVDLDKVNNSKTIFFLFYPGLINDGKEFKVCLSYFRDYDREILCKRDVNTIGNKQEKIEFIIPKIIDLGSLISNAYLMNPSTNNNNGSVGSDDSNINNVIKKISYNNTSVEATKANISDFNNTELRYVSPDKYTTDLKFASSINKILAISNNGDIANQYLTQINASDIPNNLTENKLAGNNVLHINGFEFDEQNQKIYAFGDYHYLKGNEYDIRFGLAPEYHDHSIFVIDPKISQITDSIKLWGGEEEGDETTIGDIFVNSKNDNLYVTALDEGEMDQIFIIDASTLKIKKIVSINNVLKGYFDDQASYDKINDILYMCSDDMIVGIQMDDFHLVKNLSSIYCPQTISPKNQIGYFMSYYDLNGFIDLTKGDTSLLLKGGNVSDIFINENGSKTAFVVGHNTNEYPYSCSLTSNKVDGPPTSYIIKINTEDKSVTSIYKFDNVYIDEIIKDPNSGKLYALTVGIVSDPYMCYENSKLYDLGDLLEKEHNFKTDT